jgi:membrane protein
VEAIMTVPPSQEPPPQRPVGQLVGDAVEQLSRLVRNEMRLAAAEVRDKGKRAGAGAGLFGAAGVLAGYGGAALAAAAIVALGLVVAWWLAAVIVGAVLLLTAGILAALGTRQVKTALPPVPEDTADSVKADIQTVKEGLHR